MLYKKSPDAPATRGVVEVGPYLVADVSRSDLVERICEEWLSNSSIVPTTAFALHVGGLNSRRNEAFVESMRAASVVYADGSSVVGLAKAAGAKHIERSATTDIGWDVLQYLGERLGRKPRIALIGGPPGLAERAGAVFDEAGVAQVLLEEHGYHCDWDGTLARLRELQPDVCIVGMGAPREMIWVSQNLGRLPPSLVVTCGGWLGFVVGDERRAPGILQSAGLEWTSRLVRDPQRLMGRYALGAASCLFLLPTALRARARVRAA